MFDLLPNPFSTAKFSFAAQLVTLGEWTARAWSTGCHKAVVEVHHSRKTAVTQTSKKLVLQLSRHRAGYREWHKVARELTQ